MTSSGAGREMGSRSLEEVWPKRLRKSSKTRQYRITTVNIQMDEEMSNESAGEFPRDNDIQRLRRFTVFHGVSSTICSQIISRYALPHNQAEEGMGSSGFPATNRKAFDFFRFISKRLAGFDALVSGSAHLFPSEDLGTLGTIGDFLDRGPDLPRLDQENDPRWRPYSKQVKRLFYDAEFAEFLAYDLSEVLDCRTTVERQIAVDDDEAVNGDCNREILGGGGNVQPGAARQDAVDHDQPRNENLLERGRANGTNVQAPAERQIAVDNNEAANEGPFRGDRENGVISQPVALEDHDLEHAGENIPILPIRRRWHRAMENFLLQMKDFLFLPSAILVWVVNISAALGYPMLVYSPDPSAGPKGLYPPEPTNDSLELYIKIDLIAWGSTIAILLLHGLFFGVYSTISYARRILLLSVIVCGVAAFSLRSINANGTSGVLIGLTLSVLLLEIW